MSASTIPPLSISQERKMKQKLWLERLKQLEQKEIWLKAHPLVPEYKPRLSEPSAFWLVFFRQKQAFECTTAHPQDVHTFAFEPENPTSPRKGLRKFVVTSHAQLWHTVKALAHSDERYGSFYEVIPEGAACKLYFDLEFSRDLNPDAAGGAMVKTLIEFVCFELKQFYNIHCNESHVINLDASTGSKFSCHLIFNVPGAIFKDNLHAGNFVRHLCSRIESYCRSPEQSLSDAQDRKESGDCERAGSDNIASTCSDNHEPPAKKSRSGESDEERSNHGNQTTRQPGCEADDAEEFKEKDKLRDMYINVPNGGKELFIDLAVYTRNRNFRLYKCVKLGKLNPLLVAADNRYQVKMNSKKKPARPGGEEYQLFLDSLITHVKFAPHTRVLTCKGEEGSTKSSYAAKRMGQDSSSPPSGREERAETIEGYLSSPFPEIDSYIRGYCISQGGVAGEVRRWTYFSEAQLLVYDIVKNRWCENIGRQHRSNNIMILVDLRRGVYYQKCHDPTCRTQNYKSDERPVPPEHLPSFTDWDEEELINVSLRVEEDARLNESRSCSDFDSFLDDDDADEELMRLGERYDDDAQETGDNDRSSHRTVNHKNVVVARTIEETELLKQCAESCDGDLMSAGGAGRDEAVEDGKGTSGGGEDGWDDHITDDELMRSFQE